MSAMPHESHTEDYGIANLDLLADRISQGDNPRAILELAARTAYGRGRYDEATGAPERAL